MERMCERCNCDLLKEIEYFKLERWFERLSGKHEKDSHTWFCSEECMFQYFR